MGKHVSVLRRFSVHTDLEQSVLVHYNGACDWTVSASTSLPSLMRIADRHAAACDGKPQPAPPLRSHPANTHLSRLWQGEVSRALG